MTHLLGQSVEQLADNVAAYRAAWAAAGHPGDGQVTLMLHCYLHTDPDEARRIAREPLKSYLATATGLLRDMASAFPTFAGSGRDADEAFASLTPDELDQLLDMAAARYLETSGLFGAVDDAVAIMERCGHAGVDEIACLIDFGIETGAVLASLPLLGEAHRPRRRPTIFSRGRPDRRRGKRRRRVRRLRHGRRPRRAVSTDAPAMHAVACDDARRRPGESRWRSATIEHLMLGGEALPTALAAELRVLLTGRITNMYGPTETTIWSLVHEVVSVPEGNIPIGAPIGNTTIHVLDRRGQQVPPGVFGELHIGGDGVARGAITTARSSRRIASPSGSGSAACMRPGTSCVSAPMASVEFAGAPIIR